MDTPYRYTPPRPDQAIAFLISGGWRVYQCGEPGEGRVLVWAKTCYDDAGYPDFGATMRRITGYISDCTEIIRVRMDQRLLPMMSETLLFFEDDSSSFRLRRLKLAKA